MALPIDHWLVEEIVSTLTEAPDTCILLGRAHTPTMGHPRIRRDGQRVHLVRYLNTRITGETLPMEVALLPGGCKTPDCQNPLHRVQSRRRTHPKRKDPHG